MGRRLRYFGEVPTVWEHVLWLGDLWRVELEATNMREEMQVLQEAAAAPPANRAQQEELSRFARVLKTVNEAPVHFAEDPRKDLSLRIQDMAEYPVELLDEIGVAHAWMRFRLRHTKPEVVDGVQQSLPLTYHETALPPQIFPAAVVPAEPPLPQAPPEPEPLPKPRPRKRAPA